MHGPVSRTLVVLVFVLLGLGRERPAHGAAQLIPEHQHRLGTCPDGSSCQWDCVGSQCDFGFGGPICVNDADCSFLCLPGPICDDGATRQACALPGLGGFDARLVVRVDENDALCASPGTGCNQDAFSDDCGSRVTIALRGRPEGGGAQFAISKDINLCVTGALACAQIGDCDQCLAGGTGCPRPDPVLLCNGQGTTDLFESSVLPPPVGIGDFVTWLNDMQPFGFLKFDLPPELQQQGIPVIIGATQTASGRFCTGTGEACDDDVNCPSGESCFAQGDFCVRVAMIQGRCIGGDTPGTLCGDDSQCGEGFCGIPGAPPVPVTGDSSFQLTDMGACGGCPAAPSAGCTDFGAGLLLAQEKTPGDEKLVAKFLDGPALAGTDFGDPLQAGGTDYSLCVYDDGGTLAGTYRLARAGATCGQKPCWKSLGGLPGDANHIGYRYKDAETTADGVLLLLMKSRGPGKTKVVAKGRNSVAKGQSSLPTGLAVALAGSGGATVQLHGSDAPTCLSMTLSTVVKDDGAKFKARP